MVGIIGGTIPRMPRPSQTLTPTTSPTHDWQSHTPVALWRNVRRLTAPNPGLMTGPGTNSYLVGDAHSGFIVIDPGPPDAQHVQRLWEACTDAQGRGGHITLIACTHSHADHAPAAPLLQALCPQRPPIVGLPSAPTARSGSHFVPDRALQSGEKLQIAGTENHTLHAVFTPGHAANHVCFVLEEDGLLFSGDHILNGSTTVIDPPDGHMGDYLDSLDRLHQHCEALGVQHILPAHGGVIDAPLQAIAQLKAHRLKREAKVAAVMQAQPDGDLDSWLPLAYDDVPPQLWPVARRSLQAHVEHVRGSAGQTRP